MNTIQKLKERWKGYKEKRFLETHGCKTWREYELRNDPDVGYLARWAHTYYHGYKYIWPYPHEAPTFTANEWSPEKAGQMAMWCERNCQGKWRNDWHRGFWDHQGNFEFNGIGGSDFLFFAFNDSKDFMTFRLVWE